MPIKQVLIVDDHKLFRAALSNLLEQGLGSAWRVLTAANSQEALEIVTEKPQIQVLLLDIQMPGVSGLDLLELLRKRSYTGGILMLSQHDNPMFINHAMRYGANGFLLKDCTPDELYTAIGTVADGGFHDNELAQEWRKHTPLPENDFLPLKLSPREYELISHLKQGESSKEIAKFLKLSLLTVESYRKKLLKRTNTKNVAQLISFITEVGLFKKSK